MVEPVPHGLQLLRGVAGPADELADHAQRLAAPEGLRRVVGEPLVRDVGVVLERPRRLDDVDVAPARTCSKLAAPGRGSSVAVK